MFDTFLLPLGGGGVGAPEFFVVGVLRFKFVLVLKVLKFIFCFVSNSLP